MAFDSNFLSYFMPQMGGLSADAPLESTTWVTYTPASATILDSEGVSSLTDNAAGDTTVNWTSNFPSANYAIAATCHKTGGFIRMVVAIYNAAGNPAIGSVRVVTQQAVGTTGFDVDRAQVIAVGG